MQAFLQRHARYHPSLILIVALLGGFRDWGRGRPFYGTGYYGGGGLDLLLVIALILVVAGRV